MLFSNAQNDAVRPTLESAVKSHRTGKAERVGLMLVDLQNMIGDYFHDVFVNNVDWWVLLGVVAQGLFTMRFVVQWIASEKAQRSVVPMTFWWFSIGGGALLLMYALYRRDPVFILGQGFGVFVYIRNLQFVLRAKARGEDTNSGPG